MSTAVFRVDIPQQVARFRVERNSPGLQPGALTTRANEPCEPRTRSCCWRCLFEAISLWRCLIRHIFSLCPEDRSTQPYKVASCVRDVPLSCSLLGSTSHRDLFFLSSRFVPHIDGNGDKPVVSFFSCHRRWLFDCCSWGTTILDSRSGRRH